MRRLNMSVLLVAYALLGCAAGTCAEQAPEVKPEPTPIDARRVKELVAQLGSEDFADRDKAQKALEAMGEAVLAEVDKFKGEISDPEITQRIKQLKNYFMVVSFEQQLARLNASVDALLKASDMDRKVQLEAMNVCLKEVRALERAAKHGKVSLLHARALFKHGTAWYRKYKQGTNMNFEMEQASAYLEACVDAYDRYLELHSEDEEAQNQQTEAAMLMYATVKYKSLR